MLISNIGFVCLLIYWFTGGFIKLLVNPLTELGKIFLLTLVCFILDSIRNSNKKGE